MQRGDTLVIGTELLDVAKVSQLWGAQYNRKLADIFVVQEDIAREISEKLRLQLTGEERKKLAKPVTRNKEAYQLYLKALYFAHKWSQEGLKKAVEYCRQAIEQDPALANAYAVMAWSYAVLGHYGFLPPMEAFPKAKAAALQALALDEGLSQAHAALALTRLLHDWDLVGGERECRRALELNPDDTLAHIAYVHALLVTGRLEEAVAEGKRAVELEPLSPAVNFQLGGMLFYARQYDQAIEQFRKALELDPSMMPEVMLAFVYAQKGMYAEAEAECEKARLLPGGELTSRGVLGYVHALAGRREEALNILEELKPLLEENVWLRFRAALIWTALNERDQAFALLEELCNEHFFVLNFLKVAPYSENLRSDPRFAALLRRMGLEQ
jgi:tetratricopeptide (TPR) repeat protein